MRTILAALVSLFFLLGSQTTLVAEQTDHAYTAQFLKSFPNRPEPNGLVVADIQGYTGPEVPIFVGGEFANPVIYDPLQKRIVFLDQKNFIAKVMPYSEESNLLSRIGSVYLGQGLFTGLTLTDQAGKVLVRNAKYSKKTFGKFPMFLIGEEIILSDQSGQRYSFDLGGQSAVLRDATETRNTLQALEVGGVTDVRIKDDGELFMNGDFLPTNFSQFKSHFKTLGGFSKGPLVRDIAETSLRFDDEDLDFFGRDANGNWYWGHRGWVAVFNINGALLDSFVSDVSATAVGDPFVSPNGDLFFLSNTSKDIDLYKVENRWDRSFSVATVNDAGVRLRKGPGRGQEKLSSLGRSELVAVLDQSAEAETIEGAESHWIHVRTSSGLYGWVFGAFLDIRTIP